MMAPSTKPMRLFRKPANTYRNIKPLAVTEETDGAWQQQ